MIDHHLKALTCRCKGSSTAAILLLAFACFTLVGCLGASGNKAAPDILPEGIAPAKSSPIFIQDLSPSTPPATDALKPGLTVTYFTNFFKRHLRFLTKDQDEKFVSKPGKPIAQLNHHFGRMDKIFDSGVMQGVAMRIEGLIHLGKAGEYAFQAISNDGILVYLDGKLMIDDPDQHSDRLSNLAVVKLTASGWYPIKIEYFQRKGTATLKLYWRRPGEKTLRIVPAEAFAHQPPK